MSVSVSMPQLGESVTEGTVTRWLKKEGERVEADEPLLEVSTDKVDTEIPSPAAGVLREIAVGEDETVEVGAQLAVIEEGAGAGPAGHRVGRRPGRAGAAGCAGAGARGSGPGGSAAPRRGSGAAAPQARLRLRPARSRADGGDTHGAGTNGAAAAAAGRRPRTGPRVVPRRSSRRRRPSRPSRRPRPPRSNRPRRRRLRRLRPRRLRLRPSRPPAATAPT